MGAKYPLQIPSDAQLDQKNYNYCPQVGGLIGRAGDGSNCFRKMIYKLDSWLRNEFSYYYSFAEWIFIHIWFTNMIIDYEMNFHIIICLQSEFIRTDWFKWNLENKKLIDIVFIRNQRHSRCGWFRLANFPWIRQFHIEGKAFQILNGWFLTKALAKSL